ncbi:hypothetical protein CYMTET_26710 [Cymbomonas tetramitiformis]|uniref:Mandelate racemase/muconate lactonizing enzyme C-terminal domain-containing protein n=1 Tax=Cymbomonas tetramitiformis TaxID=36881 RepID=A0AAE0KXM4_9CHLO|nr:hypothetical protein CYMTET_26710 [Cymbomonas tetramitiformis]
MGRSQMDAIHGDDDLVQSMFLRHVAPLAYQGDISTPETLSNLTKTIMYLNYKNTGQILSRAISGLDTAAWDVLGKKANKTVCDLVSARLDTTCREVVPVYCTNLTRNIATPDLIDLIVSLRKETGVSAFKYKIARTMGRNTDVYPGRTEEVIPLVRKEIDKLCGPGVKLMVDANGGYEQAGTAGAIAKLMQGYNYEWFEEPVPFWNYTETKKVKELGVVRIAAGENEYRADNLDLMIDSGIVDIVQPDFGYAGGFSQVLRVAQRAAMKGIKIDPHSPDRSMTEFFSAHLMAAVSNAGPFLEYGCVDRSTPGGVFEDPIVIRNGTISVPKAPGWGVQLTEKWLNQSSSIVYP